MVPKMRAWGNQTLTVLTHFSFLVVVLGERSHCVRCARGIAHAADHSRGGRRRVARLAERRPETGALRAFNSIWLCELG